MSLPTPDNRESAIRKVEDLHGNMAVLARLHSLLRNPNSNLDDVARLIQSDGPLSATIIRLSNSVYYGGAQRSKDVFSALRKVGMNEALRLVSMALSKQVFMRDLRAYGISADDYWRYSYCCAVYMDHAGKRHGLDSALTYLTGLLHAVGRVLINEMLHDKAIDIYWDDNLEPEIWEEVMVGMRYPEAGALLLDRWGFPSEIVTCVREQTNANKADTEPMHILLDFIRRWALLNRTESSGAWLPLEQHPYLELENIDEQAVQADLQQALHTVNSVQEMLKNC